MNIFAYILEKVFGINWLGGAGIDLDSEESVKDLSDGSTLNWKPQVVKIEKVEHHPAADNLDIATVLGDYPVIIKRNEYKVGDLVCYFPIDTIFPDTEQFYFLCPKAYEKYEEGGEIKQRQVGSKYMLGQVPEKYRILKAKKIRGIYSQGMLVPIPNKIPDSISNAPYQVIKEGDHVAVGQLRPLKENFNFSGESSLKIGQSVISLFNLKKWQEEEEENLPNVKKTKGINGAPPPKGYSIPYYDIESVRKYLRLIENEQDIILTEKLNGSNASFVFDENTKELVIKSRNFYKKHDPDDMWVDLAIRYNLKEKLSKYPMMVLFGECVNQIKNFRYTTDIIDGVLLTKLYCFDIFDIKNNKYLDYDNFISIIRDLGLEETPQLYRGPWIDKVKMYDFANGKSTINPKVIREGWVLSLGKERFEPKLNGRLKLKLVGENFNLNK